MKKIIFILTALFSFSNIALVHAKESSANLCQDSKEFKNTLSPIPNKKLGNSEDNYYGYDDFRYIPYYDNDGFTVKFEIENKVYNTVQQMMDDSEVTIAVSRYPMAENQGELILSSMLLTSIDLPPEATQTYYYHEGETHLVYLYKKGKLDYVGVFDVEKSSKNEYDKLAKNIVLSEKEIDYLSNLTVIKEDNKITIYSQSKYGKGCSVHYFNL